MERTNFYYLFLGLLIFLLAIPLANDLGLASAPVVRVMVFSAMLIIGVWSLGSGGHYFRLGLAFVAAGVVLNTLAINLHSPPLQYSSLLALIGFLFVAIAYTLKQVAFGTEVNANRLVGAVCVYLLLGVIWALAYSIVELATPGSFAGFTPWADRGWDSEWIYFSFVTMTTLGYGDILPISATARAMAYMQAVFGQFYVAVLVAGLVSAYISQKD